MLFTTTFTKDVHTMFTRCLQKVARCRKNVHKQVHKTVLCEHLCDGFVKSQVDAVSGGTTVVPFRASNAAQQNI
jgi:hypothetical protein